MTPARRHDTVRAPPGLDRPERRGTQGLRSETLKEDSERPTRRSPDPADRRPDVGGDPPQAHCAAALRQTVGDGRDRPGNHQRLNSDRRPEEAVLLRVGKAPPRDVADVGEEVPPR